MHHKEVCSLVENEKRRNTIDTCITDHHWMHRLQKKYYLKKSALRSYSIFSKVDFLYQFWKLKRKANFNRPLVTLKRDEVDNLAQQEQDVLYRRLKLFTHLRQDLERVSSTCLCLVWSMKLVVQHTVWTCVYICKLSARSSQCCWYKRGNVEFSEC